jgi:NAD(P)-dependent dehydrogenase (short-subunit alcohol dehydrogenase family)
MDLGLKGRRAIVTGGSRGIGYAIASELAGEGVDVAIVSRTSAEAEAAANAISASTGAKVIATPADTSIDESVRAMVAQVNERLGPPDILVNCAAAPAGQGKTPNIDEVTYELLAHQINVKVMGYLRVVQAVLPGMRTLKRGRIISIAGMSARKAGDTIGSIRNVSIVAMSKNLAEELAGTGISSVVVHPGLTKTDKVAALIEREAAAQNRNSADFEASLTSGILNPRLPTPEDIAGIVTFLASDRACAINGELVAAAGGTRVAIHY